MAKNSKSASQAVEVVKSAAERIAELKAQRDQAAAELAKLKAEAEALEAKAAEENKVKLEAATSKLAGLVRKALEGMDDDAALLAVVSSRALLANEESDGEGNPTSKSGKALKTAVEEYESLIPAKKSKGSGNGATRVPTDTVKITQKRILTYLASLDKDATASRRELACVALGKPFDTTDRITTFGGEVIGNVRDDNSAHPYSLLSRGWIEVVETDHEGTKEKAFKLTKAGREAAAENEVELPVQY